MHEGRDSTLRNDFEVRTLYLCEQNAKKKLVTQKFILERAACTDKEIRNQIRNMTNIYSILPSLEFESV